MKVLVAYYSETGNTKKIAEAIFDEINPGKRDKVRAGHSEYARL